MRIVSLLVVVFVGLLSGCSTHLDSLSYYQQYQKDTTAIRKYLSQNSIPATKLPSGIWFIIDSQGTGIRGTYSDTVGLTYKMKLIPTNTVADEYSTPTNFRLPDLPLGVRIALPYFQKGAKGRIFIPSYFGYQSNPNGAIPANANLLFDFNLTNVIDHHLNQDTLAIDDYLFNHDIGATKDPSGLRYTIDSVGTGSEIPYITDSVTVKYTAKYFNGSILQTQTTPVKLPLASLIMGWQIALPIIPEGSFMTLYIPSSLAYGPSPDSSLGILPNTNLIYTIKLVKVHHH